MSLHGEKRPVTRKRPKTTGGGKKERVARGILGEEMDIPRGVKVELSES